MWYLITEDKKRELFEEYKASGVMPQDADYNQWHTVTFNVLPPGRPDPCDDRH
jgi:hypothetical protein